MIKFLNKNMDYLEIYIFWKKNPSYWISIENKKQADQEIYDLFYDKLPIYTGGGKKSFIGYIIYLDQITKHFNDYLNNHSICVEEYRKIAVQELDKLDVDFFINLEEDELYFCLMPYKHLKQYDKCFDYCKKWCFNKNKLIKETNIISKFFYDTYRKAYSNHLSNYFISNKYIVNDYEPKEICEYHTEEYVNTNWLSLCKNKFINDIMKKYVKHVLNIKEEIIVSLSGGVDSMTLLFLLKMLNINVKAVHINYCNRDVSGQGYSFVSTFCSKLDIPFYGYSIEWIKRHEVDREFYEDITKIIRFNVYKNINTNPIVILGHIKEDVIENIWTNISKCEHMPNLKKMVYEEKQYDVRILRLLLDTTKKEIFNISKLFNIPYLKNTTPEWSNRGKFRKYFYNFSQEYFGENIDNNMIKFSEIIQKQYEIINNIIYKPILESYKDNTFNITSAVNGDIGLDNWKYLIEKICHSIFGIKKPSIHSIKNFYEKIFKHQYNFKCHMRKDYNFIIFNVKNDIFLKIDIVSQ